MIERTENHRIVIIGAGPAGLTAAYELASRSDHKILILEATGQVGGISKTVDFKGNKIDIGGHRFFSKSDWVLDWWQKFLPIKTEDRILFTTYQNQSKAFEAKKAPPEAKDGFLLVRPRKSRIIYRGNLFEYPLKLNFRTLWSIGIWKSISIFLSLIYSRLRPIQNEKNLEDFYINRFGRVLYRIFFEDYTQKVWGKPCREISAEWGYQRVKGLGFRSILRHYFTTLFFPRKQLLGNRVEQTLTEYFLYPEKGPGQMWETVARKCEDLGVEFRFHQSVDQLLMRDANICELTVNDKQLGTDLHLEADVVISTMPVKQLVEGLNPAPPKRISEITDTLEYRDFIIVGLLLDKLTLNNKGGSIEDNWLYVQDSSVLMGRIQFFHNWSPYMTAKSDTMWLGAEYFCCEGDHLWKRSDQELLELAYRELHEIGVVGPSDKLEGKVIRMPKAYPSYVGSYQHFEEVRSYLITVENLYLIGRNGTHRYNNQDHSMLSAKEAVDNIIKKQRSKDNIWRINSDKEYHEELNN